MKESVGQVRCPICEEGQIAEVRKNEKGKLYVFCKECGIHHLNSAKGQEWILANATLYGPEGKPAAPVQKPKPAAAPKPQPKPAPAEAANVEEESEEDEF